jgi:hypothetical protein
VLDADISLTTLLTASRQAGCGDPHPVFAKGLRYIPPSSAGRVNRAAFEELSEHGFTQGDGFTPEFDDVLHLLDQPATEFYAFARDLTGQCGILVAVRGRSAVSALCHGERVRLRLVHPDTRPVDALVGQLPPFPAARIKPFTLPQREFQDAEVNDVFDDAPARSRAAQQLDSLLQQPHHGVGQFYAAQYGERLGVRDSLSYLDLDAGRVGLGLAGGYISVLPGEPGLLGREVAGLVNA